MTDRSNNTSPPYGLLSQSVLNGVIGDYLDRTENPLAIQMGLYHRLSRLNLDSTNLESTAEYRFADIELTNKVVILVHGLTNLETVWDYPKPDVVRYDVGVESNANENYGTKLQSEFGYTPLFLRYNTGLPIATNGCQLSETLEQLFEAYPITIDELTVIGFSMGGLLLRSAQMNAQDTGKTWLKALSNCIYIGTPHEGSPLEKFGHLTAEIVRNIPIDHVNHWAEWIDIRSQGIKDLKLGLKPQSKTPQNSVCGTFFPGAKHYFISGSLGRTHNSIAGRVFGDSLVRQSSAIPSHRPNESQCARFENIPHIPLAHSHQVYQQIRKWISQSSDKVKIKIYKPKNRKPLEQPYQEEKLNEKASVDNLLGALSIASDTAGIAIETSETMHRSIAKIPFNVLRHIPVVNQVSAPVELIHNEVSGAIYGYLKTGAKKARRAFGKS